MEGNGEALSTAVVRAVADREGVDPIDLEQPLYAVVDSEALDDLFSTAEGSVTFEYHGYVVTAHSDGTVDLDPVE
ncbi:HalOD1 output domain-containing protein [Halobacteriales archaeon Cl-PHB]